MLAARKNICVIEKTCHGVARKVTECKINKHMMGKVRGLFRGRGRGLFFIGSTRGPMRGSCQFWVVDEVQLYVIY